MRYILYAAILVLLVIFISKRSKKAKGPDGFSKYVKWLSGLELPEFYMIEHKDQSTGQSGPKHYKLVPKEVPADFLKRLSELCETDARWKDKGQYYEFKAPDGMYKSKWVFAFTMTIPKLCLVITVDHCLW